MTDIARKHTLGTPRGRLKRQRDQEWIDGALASGPAAPLTEKEMDVIRDRVLKRDALKKA